MKNAIEGVIPYGNANAQIHLRFKDDYKTFCGRLCEGWTPAETDEHEIINSVYGCKKCIKVYFK